MAINSANNLNTKNNQSYSQPKKIAIIDNFTQKFINIDSDNKPDIEHGKVVRRIIEEKVPNSTINEYNVEPCNEKSFNSAMKSLFDNTKEGKPYDAINMSMSQYISFKSLSSQIGEEINPENIGEKKDKIKNWLKTFEPTGKIIDKKQYGMCSDLTDKMLKDSYNNLVLPVEKLSQKGTKIYISAGNHGKDYLNIASLADNVNIVGSLNNGIKSKYSADNSSVNAWAQGEFKITKIKDSNGNSGFDFTQDGSIDISSKNTTSFFKFASNEKIEGTSFSSPKKLAEDLSK